MQFVYEVNKILAYSVSTIITTGSSHVHAWLDASMNSVGPILDETAARSATGADTEVDAVPRWQRKRSDGRRKRAATARMRRLAA